MSRLRILESKIRDSINLITKLKEENRTLKTENMKLFSELELMKNDIRTANKLRSEYEYLAARDKKIKDKIYDLRNRIDRLNI